MIYIFDESQSECIHSLVTWENKPQVTIIFQNKPQEVYTFTSYNVTQIEEFFLNRTNESIGKQYHKWIADGTLRPIAQPVAV